jgi:serine/threonine protein kinase
MSAESAAVMPAPLPPTIAKHAKIRPPVAAPPKPIRTATSSRRTSLVDAPQDRPEHVYLSDFGVSKGAISSVSLTGSGHFVGTPDHSAPEQIQGRGHPGRPAEGAEGVGPDCLRCRRGRPHDGPDQSESCAVARGRSPCLLRW